MTVHEMYEMLVYYVGINAKALELLTAVNGYNEETMKDALYVYTGYHDFDQYIDELEEEGR